MRARATIAASAPSETATSAASACWKELHSAVMLYCLVMLLWWLRLLLMMSSGSGVCVCVMRMR